MCWRRVRRGGAARRGGGQDGHPRTGLAPVHGAWTCVFAPFLNAGDLHQAHIVETVQHGSVESAPHSCSRPDQEPAVSRSFDRCPEARQQGPPGAAGDQDADDRGEQRLIRCVLRPAVLRPHLQWRDQRLRDRSQSGTIQPQESPPHDHSNGS